MRYTLRLADVVYSHLERLPADVRYEVEAQLKSLAQLPETGEPFDFPFAGGRRWTFTVPAATGERAFSVVHIPDHERRIVEIVGLGELDLT